MTTLNPLELIKEYSSELKTEFRNFSNDYHNEVLKIWTEVIRLQEQIKQLEERRANESSEEIISDIGWSIEDYAWRLDDIEWTIDDLKADIRNTQFEIDSRENMERSSRATYWAVFGAAIFALGGLFVDIYSIFQW